MNHVIEKFYWAWNDVKKVKELSVDIVYNYSDHLRNGTWKLLWSDKAFLVRIPGKGLSFYRRYFEHQKKFSPWWTVMKAYMQNILCINKKYHCKDRHSHIFYADCLMLSKNGAANFYDLEKMIIKKQYGPNCLEGYYKLKSAGYFDIFPTSVISIQDNTAIEKLIIYQNNSISDAEHYNLILKKYIRYLDNSHAAEQHSISEIVAPYKKLVSCFNKIFSDTIMNIKLNFYVMHGDFHSNNVLVSKTGKMYVIDYELAGNHPFFQDLLWFATKKVDSGKCDWSIIDELMDPKSEIGLLFDNILISQCIPTDKNTKIALFVLTRIWYYDQVVKLEQWTERKLEKFYYNREKKVIGNLIERYMHI